MPDAPSVPAPGTRPGSASILINNFNYGRYVAAAIDSALAQTHPAQVIVVDDGSTDDSKQVIAGYETRVQVIYTSNRGQGAAMNSAFAQATGDLVLFLDSDDMLASTVVETLLREWRPGVVLAQYPLHIVDESGQRLGLHPDTPSRLSDGDVRQQLLDTGSYEINVTSGLAFLRSALSFVMPVPEQRFRMAADGYLVRAVVFWGTVQRLEEPLAFYRRHASNDSNVVATAGGLAYGLRRKIEFARNELDVTKHFAARHGLQARADLGERNADYIGYQLFLLLADPAAGRDIGASRRALLPRYLKARWASTWPLQRRLLAMTIATAAAIVPTPAATTLLQFLHDPHQRPAWWQAVARRLRRA